MTAESVTEREVAGNCCSRCIGCLTGCLACCWEYWKFVSEDRGSFTSDTEELSRDFDPAEELEESKNADDGTTDGMTRDIPSEGSGASSSESGFRYASNWPERKSVESASRRDAAQDVESPQLIAATFKHQSSEM